MNGDRQTTGHGAKFGRKQEQAITALLTQRNVDEAANATGIAPKTLWRWMQLPEFQQGISKGSPASVCTVNRAIAAGVFSCGDDVAQDDGGPAYAPVHSRARSGKRYQSGHQGNGTRGLGSPDRGP
jgi:hypothetical protein